MIILTSRRGLRGRREEEAGGRRKGGPKPGEDAPKGPTLFSQDELGRRR